MIETTWFKRILYTAYTIGCGFSGYVIYFAAKNGMLHTGILDHLAVKAMIIGIPAVLCIIFDKIYHPYNMFEAFAWETALCMPFVFMLIGYFIVGGKQAVSVFELSIPASVMYGLMYGLSLLIIYLLGLFAIWIGEDKWLKHSSTRTNSESPTSSPTPKSQCGPGGWPSECGPNYIPHFGPNSE